MKTTKWFILILIVALVASISAACGNTNETSKETSKETSNHSENSTDSKKVALRFGTNFVSGGHQLRPMIDRLFSEYLEEHPNVSINIEEAPGYDLQTKIQLDATSNNLPDVFSYWVPDPAYGLDQMIEAGLLADLTEFTSEPSLKELFGDDAWGTASIDGKVYGVPLVEYYMFILANKEIFEKAGAKIPETWEELLDAEEKLKAAGYIPWGSSVQSDHGQRLFNYVFSRILTSERALNMLAGNEPMNVPEAYDAAEKLKELVVGNIPKDANAIDHVAMYERYINTEQAALLIDVIFRIESIAPELREKMVPIEFPLIPGGAETEKRVEKDLTQLLYVSAKSWDDPEKRPYIESFIKKLTSRDAAKAYAEEAKYPIPHQGVDIDPDKVGELAYKTLQMAQAVRGNKWLPTVMQPEKRERWLPMLEEFLVGGSTPEEFVNQMHNLFYEG